MALESFMIVAGTRPEIIKMAPVYAALRERGKRTVVVHSGQHDAMAHALYRFFRMPPDIAIDLRRKSPCLSHLTTALLDAMEDVLCGDPVDAVLVQGDTTTAMVGALAAYYHDLPVAHVEAGLRTREREPFPEEKNRELIGRIACWHFAPTREALANLLEERIAAGRAYEVGNTVIDAALTARRRLAEDEAGEAGFHLPSVSAFLASADARRLILVTAHRRENWGEPIREIVRALGDVLARHDDVVAVWPVHPNPSVRDDVGGEVSVLPASVQSRICLTEPADYPALIDLLSRCAFTITDSGGIQEEASAFSKPVLIARRSTERVELVRAGGALLVGTDREAIVANACALLDDPSFYRSMQVAESPFGDGRSAERIAGILTGQ